MSITAYKGFNSDFTCRGFQFEVGKTYTVDGKIEACINGFHACENPLDVFSYYLVGDDGSLARFAEVIQSGTTARHAEDSKIASAEITIKAEISFPDFIKHAIAAFVDLVKPDGSRHASSGIRSRHASSGIRSQHASSGDHSQHASSGYHSQHASSGYHSQHASSGDHSQHASSGDHSRHASSGYHSQHASSGNCSRHASSGYNSQHASSGNGSRIKADGKNSVIASAGRGTSAIGADGTWISLAEFNAKDECIGFATGCIGKDGLKAGVTYIAKNGKLVEAAA